MSRIDFNRAFAEGVRRVLQCAAREELARTRAAIVRENHESSLEAYESARLALAMAGNNTEAAIMEWSDQLYDAITIDESETAFPPAPFTSQLVLSAGATV